MVTWWCVSKCVPVIVWVSRPLLAMGGQGKGSAFHVSDCKATAQNVQNNEWVDVVIHVSSCEGNW